MALRQIFKTQIGAVDTTARDVIGSLRIENDILYKYVKVLNVAGVAGKVGDPIAYKATYAAGFSVSVCTTKVSEADAQPLCAGFLTGTVSLAQSTAGVWTWIQLTGPVVVSAAILGTPVIGSGVMLSATDLTLTLVTGVIQSCGTSTSTSAPNNAIIADCDY